MRHISVIRLLTTIVVVGALNIFIAPAAAATGSITLTISCYTNPERSTITNNTDQVLPLGQVRLASLHQPRSDEPFTLGNTSVLSPGQAITFQTGSASAPSADSPRLSSEAIYNNEEQSEGARLETPYGTLTVLCSVGSGTLTISTPGETCRAFGATGKRACGRFLEYWIANGGLAQQGYPITDEFTETNPSDGKRYTVQYFERARFELHPENQAPYNVLLGLLGTEQFRPRYPGGVAPVGGDPFAGDNGGRDCARFDQTGQTVCGPFLRYWQANGGLAQQGYPLGPVFLETNPTDGRQYPTQYFERARFEYHREFANTPNAVLLGLLGREQYLAKYQPGSAPAPTPPPAANPAPRAGTQITITPRQGPNSTLFVVTGIGFTANTTYYLQIASQDGKAAINFDDASTRSDADGVLLAGFSFGSAVPAGSYTARIATAVSGGPALATTSFTLTGTSGARPGPDVVVTPSQGRGGDTFILTGTGFAPNATFSLRVQTEDRQTTISFNNSDLESDADGVILSGFSLSAQRPTGAYIVEVLSKAATPAVLASTTFSLTGATTAPTPVTSATPSPSATPRPPTAVPTPTTVPQPPAPTPTPTNPRAGCDPSYPTICLPSPPPDLDCGQIPYRNFLVNKPDPHRFDNDNDGIGCES
jgi:hypothetical protein